MRLPLAAPPLTDLSNLVGFQVSQTSGMTVSGTLFGIVGNKTPVFSAKNPNCPFFLLCDA